VRALGRVFAESAARHPDRPALRVGGETHTYAELLGRAQALAGAIGAAPPGDPPLCAVHAERSLWAYAGILAALLAGRGYVPLGPSFPAERTRVMLERAGATVVIADPESVEALGEAFAGASRDVTVLFPGSDAPPEWARARGRRVLCAPDIDGAGAPLPEAADGGEGVAYLLFTSGTTGVPKGIGIRDANVMSYLAAARDQFGLGPDDRCSQTFALTFDLSVHDMFVCWDAGACLCVPPARVAMAPGPFIREEALTAWFSTPSTAVMMDRLRMLTPGAFPTLRWSLFCGEALTAQTAEAWQRAAPGSRVENLYGPTEATIACTAYTWSSETSPAECVNGVVPIGRPFGRTTTVVVDDALSPVPDGEAGELLLGGDQVAPGYWRDPDRTAEAFVSSGSLTPIGPWYRTGDLAALDARANLLYRGRRDDQIKIRGHRVELQEVEAAARAASAATAAVALGWPRTPAGADGIIMFLVGAGPPDDEILLALRGRLPAYMVPSEIHRVDRLPLSPSGKVDRRRLLAEREASAGPAPVSAS
jgi:amino acid adenylation domain-containing protein